MKLLYTLYLNVILMLFVQHCIADKNADSLKTNTKNELENLRTTLHSLGYVTMNNYIVQNQNLATTLPFAIYHTLSNNKFPEIINQVSNNNYPLTINNFTNDPSIFALSIDPLSSQFPSMSPYNAMDCNPINRIDPTGKSAEATFDFETHNITVNANVNIYEEGAIEEVRSLMQRQIDEEYNNQSKSFNDPISGEQWTVIYHIQVNIINEDEVPFFLFLKPMTENYIEITKDPEHISSVNKNGRTGSWAYFNLKDDEGIVINDKNRNETTHEVGHLLGVADKYRKEVGADGKKHTIIDPEWEGSLMAHLGNPFGSREAYLSVKNALEIAKKINEKYKNENEYTIQNNLIPKNNVIYHVPINSDGGAR